jgi:hypothetical protein
MLSTWSCCTGSSNHVAELLQRPAHLDGALHGVAVVGVEGERETLADQLAHRAGLGDVAVSVPFRSHSDTRRSGSAATSIGVNALAMISSEALPCRTQALRRRSTPQST